MKRSVILLLLLPLLASAQLQESFDDGDFTQSPAWTGSVNDWIVNTAAQLQSNSLVPNSSFYLSTAQGLAMGVQWEFTVRLSFNPSSANYVDMFLLANAADLTQPTTTGYFVRIGNTQDEVSLYRKDASGTIVKLIDGADGVTNTSDNLLHIRVTRSTANSFRLLRDAGTGFVLEGTATDATYTAGGYFGILVRQSTSSFFQRHFLDDISVGHFLPDTIPPQLQAVTAGTATRVDLLFSEPVDPSTAEQPAAYHLPGPGTPLQAQRSATDARLVSLRFASPLVQGAAYSLQVQGIADLSGNLLSPVSFPFTFYLAQRNDVVLHELMADPLPPVGLPAVEYIELRNRSGRLLNLEGWRLLTAAATSAAFPPLRLPPDSLLIICAPSAAPLLAAFGRTLGLSGFPALPNESALLVLQSQEGKTIHALHYSDSWYGNTLKKAGGWSLEMVDPDAPCAGEMNWTASTAPAGGTPGKPNAVSASNPDTVPPRLLRTYTLDSFTIVAVFSKPLDSLGAAAPGRYGFLDGLQVLQALPLAPLFTEVRLKLDQPLQKGRIYTLVAGGLTDCGGTEINAFRTVKAGLPEPPGERALVINEILFNPRPAGFDFVELYNRSGKVIDVSTLFIANRSTAGVLANPYPASTAPLLLFPGDYLVLTEDGQWLQREYVVPSPGAVRTVPKLPSFPDDKGTVVLLNGQGAPIDEVAYSEDWHFPLLTNREGVSLERISTEAASGKKESWNSAAATAGYGTPGARNSQLAQPGSGAMLDIRPRVFSPDNDGRDDFVLITLSVPGSGWMVNLRLFAADGREVRHLARNTTFSESSTWKWDGLNEKGSLLPGGIYIVHAECFNLEGDQRQQKAAVVLVR